MKRENDLRVGIARLKARLSHYLKSARQGRAVTVFDRDRSVARILPYPLGPTELSIRKATRKPADVKLPPPLRGKVDSLQALLEERQVER